MLKYYYISESLTEENDDLHVDKNNDCVSLLVDENENEEEEIGVIGALKRFISIDVLCASDAYECEKCCAPVNKAVSNMTFVLFAFEYTFI